MERRQSKLKFEYVLAASRAKRCGPQWLGHCPAHDDKTPSLSIAQAPNGHTMLYCFAGCTYREIMAAFSARALRPLESEHVLRDRPDSSSKKLTNFVHELWGASVSADR